MAKACKSNGYIPRVTEEYISGERVRNTWITYPGLGDSGGPQGSLAKVPVIPDDPTGSHGLVGKAPTVLDRFMSYQLVGEVTAHQGGDGYRA